MGSTLSPASIYKTVDHVFIARALSPSTAQFGIRKIQYLRERDLAAFRGLALEENYARDFRRSKAGALARIYLHDGFAVAGATGNITLRLCIANIHVDVHLSSIHHARRIALEQSLITMK